MNTEKKTKKQEQNIRQIFQKEFVREHKKTYVMTAALFLLFLLTLGFFLYQFGKQEETQQALSLEEQAQLSDITEYLDGIDEIVMTNRENLAETMLFQSETETTLQGFLETIETIEKDLLSVEQTILEHSELETTENQTIRENLTALAEHHSELKNQIQEVNGGITTLLSEMKATDESRYTTTIEKLADIKKEIETTQKEAKEYYEALTEFLTLFQEENLTQFETMMETLLTVQTELSDLLNERFDALESLVDEDFIKLMKRLDEVHARIEEADTDIQSLLNMMEENNGTRQEEIRESFAQVGITLEEIRTEYNAAHGELQQLIVKFQESENENHQETLSTLTTMESNMTSTIAEQTNNMNTHMDSLTANLQRQFETLSATVNHYNTGQQENNDNLIAYLNQKFAQVFQYVSDGKKLLASALLTKGVEIAQDATFREIYEAILRIPQKIVIGVKELPGTITYDYHYHVDGRGNNPHTTSVSIAQAGGCYRTPIYHAHSGNSSSGGGCYSVANKGYDTIGCGGGDCVSGPHGPDSSGNVYYVGNCDNCGGHLSKYGSPGWVGCGNTTTVEYTYYTTGCGMSESTVIGYSPSCGLSDGQVVGAHIIYEPAYASAAAAFVPAEEPAPGIVEVPEDTEMQLPAPEEERAPKPSVSDNTIEEPEGEKEEIPPEEEAEPESGTGETLPGAEAEPGSGTEETPEEEAEPEGGTEEAPPEEEPEGSVSDNTVTPEPEEETDSGSATDDTDTSEPEGEAESVSGNTATPEPAEINTKEETQE